MALTSSSEIKITSIQQIGIVVKDVEKVAGNYWRILGIGPWKMATRRPPNLYDRTYHGRPAAYEFKVAYAQIGDVELELLEPLRGPTIYNDFILSHGEGLHHLHYRVKSLATIERHAEIMARHGFPSLASGRFGNDGGFNYLNTVGALKLIWEPAKKPSLPESADENADSTIKFPATEAEISSLETRVKALRYICVVVRDQREVIRNYRKFVGISPWNVFSLAPSTLYGLPYHGRLNYTFEVASAKVGPVQLLLIHPLSKDSIYSDYLVKYGEGLHSVLFEVDDISETTRTMNDAGFATLMSTRSNDGEYAYYDVIKPLKLIWGAYQEIKL